MRHERDFLTSLAQALSAMTLYDSSHPAGARAIDRAYEALLVLQEGQSERLFTFLEDEVVVGTHPLRDLRGWGWGKRLGDAGFQRLEFVGNVEREEFESFLDVAHRRLSGEVVSSAESQTSRQTAIRYGLLAVKGDAFEAEEIDREEGGAPIFDLREELDAVDWLHTEMKDGRELHLLEAETLVRSLTVAMHGDHEFLIPLVRLKEFDQYTTTHALNVSVLAMALAESLGLSPGEVRAFGIAGLLHDLGKITIPDEVLNKPGKLTESERELMNGHTTAGARLILETESDLNLAAIVAYEHHIKIDGNGYPTLRYPRKCHHASDLVHVCDVFDALRTHRPYRDAWEQDRVLKYIEEGAGTEFDGQVAQAFVKMIRLWSHRIATIVDPDSPISVPAQPPLA